MTESSFNRPHSGMLSILALGKEQGYKSYKYCITEERESVLYAVG